MLEGVCISEPQKKTAFQHLAASNLVENPLGDPKRNRISNKALFWGGARFPELMSSNGCGKHV